MNAPLLPPAVLMSLMAVARPALTEDTFDHADLHRAHDHYGEALRSYAALADEDEAAVSFKLATLYYTADEDVRAALWFLISGSHPVDGERWAVAA